MVKIPLSKIFIFFHLWTMLHLNYASIIACTLLFLPPFFISNFTNFFWPHCSCDYTAYKLMKYIWSQISENKPDETPYEIVNL